MENGAVLTNFDDDGDIIVYVREQTGLMVLFTVIFCYIAFSLALFVFGYFLGVLGYEIPPVDLGVITGEWEKLTG